MRKRETKHKQTNNTTNKEHLLCIGFSTSVLDLENHNETISLQHWLLDEQFICWWLLMWSLMGKPHASVSQDNPSLVACIASIVLPAQKNGTRALFPFLYGSILSYFPCGQTPKIPFLGLSLLSKPTQTLAMQATRLVVTAPDRGQSKKSSHVITPQIEGYLDPW